MMIAMATVLFLVLVVMWLVAPNPETATKSSEGSALPAPESAPAPASA